MQKLTERGEPSAPTPPSREGLEQLVLFQDGSQLHGRLLKLDKTELLWQRPDVNTPLYFPREEVRRIFLRETPVDKSGEAGETIRATAQFPDGNWLHGELRSPDGETFDLRAADGTKFAFGRKQVTAFQFNPQPAPAVGFYGSTLDLDQWRCPSGPYEIEVKDRTLTMHKMDWIWQPLAPMDRIQVQVEFAAESTHNVELVLSSDLKSPRSVDAANVGLFLQSDKVWLSSNQARMHQKIVPILDAPKSLRGSTIYQLFCDRLAGRATLFRNGMQCLELELDDHSPRKENGPFRGVFVRQNGMGNYIGLRMRRLQAGPWDGVLPPNDEVAPEMVRSSFGGEAPVTGKMESIGADEFVQSGITKSIKAGTRLQFAETPKSENDSEALLVLGQTGRIKARGLEIDGETVTCHPEFTELAKVPMSMLEEIDFPAKAAAAWSRDVLIFKDGDELHGTMLEAASGREVRWRSPGQREVAIMPELVAGVRFPGEASKPDTILNKRSILELRNGDRLEGEIESFEKVGMQFKDAEAGSYRIPGDWLWKLYPQRPTGWFDGSINPLNWIAAADADAKNWSDYRANDEVFHWWIHLDGAYIARRKGASLAMPESLRPPVEDPPERFEVSFNVTNISGGQPEFELKIGDFTKENAVDIFYLRDNSQFNLSRRTKDGSNSTGRSFEVSDRRFEPQSRLSVRALVDAVAGVVDLYFDGIRVLHIDSMPGMGRSVHLLGRQSSGGPTMFSDIRIGAPVAEGRMVVLRNGDIFNGEIKELNNSKLTTESDVGPLDFSPAQIQVIQFGGEYAPVKAAARARLRGGAVIHLDSFRYDNQGVSGRSAVLGEVKIPKPALEELIIDPLPLRKIMPLQERKKN